MLGPCPKYDDVNNDADALQSIYLGLCVCICSIFIQNICAFQMIDFCSNVHWCVTILKDTETLEIKLYQYIKFDLNLEQILQAVSKINCR